MTLQNDPGSPSLQDLNSLGLKAPVIIIARYFFRIMDSDLPYHLPPSPPNQNHSNMPHSKNARPSSYVSASVFFSIEGN